MTSVHPVFGSGSGPLISVFGLLINFTWMSGANELLLDSVPFSIH